MPIRALESLRPQTSPLSVLKNTVIGIDASHYLDLHLNHYITKEPLLIALGGFPFSLRSNIETELKTLHNANVGCVFVFNGLEFGKKEHNIVAQNASLRALEHAWTLYDQHHADQVVEAFGSAGSARPKTLYKLLQEILQAQGIDFIVAPYAASAQLACLKKAPNNFIDAIFGPSDVFFFEVDRVITRLDVDSATFIWIAKKQCQDDLGRLNNEQFIDFCLLLGSPFLPTFPLFENHSFPGRPLNIREALVMFNAANRSGLALCAQFEDHPRVHALQYLDRFKRAFMTVKHHVFIDVDGKVGPLEPDTVTSDLHELIGQRLPDELYFYLSKGVVGSQIPNWLTSGELTLALPVGTEDTKIYRQLNVELLTPLRTVSLALLAYSLHRFYHTKTITIRPWYEEPRPQTITLRDQSSTKDSIRPWRVEKANLPETMQDRPTLNKALSALKSADFVPKTFTKNKELLSSHSEIVSNVLWKFLQLRGYVNKDHQLTVWGQALEKALSNSDPSDDLEEPIFVAVEMLRLGVLNARDLFPNFSGGPTRGSDEDKKFISLVSRVACIGKIRHKAIGYSGPLSRQLLCFRSLVYSVRSSLRDLIEVILTTMLLNGEVNRERDDWTELSLSLPFIKDNDCGLAIAVQTYLNDLLSPLEVATPQDIAEMKVKGGEWFQHAESFPGNLDMAFRFWDAVYIATQSVGKELKDSKTWVDANKWLQHRR